MMATSPSLLLLLLAVVACAQRGPRRSTRYYGLSRDEWIKKQSEAQGPHVCATEKIGDTNHRFFKPWTNGAHCGLATEIRFECCQGFAMTPDEPGCSLVKPIENLVDSVRGNGASAFAHGISESGLEHSLSSEGPYTLFAPANHAFLNAPEELIAMLNTKTAIRGATPSILLYHLVANRIFVDQLHNEMLLETFYYSSSLRVHKFPSGLVTINCVPLVAVDLEASNGVVHKIENILRPPAHKSIGDYLVRQPTLGRIATFIIRSKMSELLHEMGSVTLFAPTDEAFAKLPQEELDAIANDTTYLVLHHVVPEVWCSSFLVEKSWVVAMDNEKLQLSCNATHKMVNGASILQSDVLAGNGFVHTIDQVLIPDKVTSLRVIAQQLPVLSFLQFLQMSSMDSVLNENTGKFTIFAPTDEAFDALNNETIQELLTNPVLLQDFIMSHLVPGEYTMANVIHKQRLNTLKRKRRLRIRLHRQRFSVDGILIKSANHRGRNGVIHLVDQVLVPPDLSISAYLESETSLSGFTGALNLTSPSLLEILASNRGGPYTVFAPDNYALSLLPPGFFARVIQESNLLNKLLSDHIVADYVITSALMANLVYPLYTTGGRVLHLRDEDGIVTVQGALIILANVRCSNGVVHNKNVQHSAENGRD
uniref:FAS1 domain-containing protein n=1 Tax=Strigamia maritima TaxID=126957 RepID=T1IRK9_STRMM